jgi:hypothetical protein
MVVLLLQQLLVIIMMTITVPNVGLSSGGNLRE